MDQVTDVAVHLPSSIAITDEVRKLDDHKFLFVTCVNDDELYDRCGRHLRKLIVPQGYKVEMLPVYGAKSMVAGYNSALQHEAKYKIYLHQDTFIVHKTFLQELLTLFQSHNSLGLLGMIGCKKFPRGGTWWDGEERIGKVIGYHDKTYLLIKYKEATAPFESVVSLDGLLMATQYDLPWRDDLFTGFHFYDASQCAEFIKRGYLVGVPHQREPWCLHVNREDHTFDKAAYAEQRRIFCEHYAYE